MTQGLGAPQGTATTYFSDAEKTFTGWASRAWPGQQDRRQFRSPGPCLRWKLATGCVNAANSNFGKKKGHVNRQQTKNKNEGKNKLVGKACLIGHTAQQTHPWGKLTHCGKPAYSLGSG